MFTSLKHLIDSRLKPGMVTDDFSKPQGHFIKIKKKDLYATVFFLKNDPDVRLGFLDQIIALPVGHLKWPKEPAKSDGFIEILYQLKSLKLPYQVTIAVDITQKSNSVASLAPLFLGAAWPEADIKASYGTFFEETV